MAFLIFIIVLGALVFVHELGHFLAAKKAGVKVDEFGFGYPPRALKIGKKWGTLFTLNWIPFGGFVKIHGENYDEAENDRRGIVKPGNAADKELSFVEVSKKWQAVILAAGVFFNLLFAWLLFSVGFLIGLPASVDNNYGGTVENPVLTVINVIPGSPAEKAGLKSGDKLVSVYSESGKILQNLNPENVAYFTSNSSGAVGLKVERGDDILDFKVKPETGIVEGKKIMGIDMDMVGTLSLPIHKAVYQGGKATFELTRMTVSGIAGLIKDAFRGRADISQIAGPVGIVGLVGDASRLGFSYLLTFTALISINLAIINLVPFPALDGGRIIFVAFEGLTKKKISSKIAGVLNTVGFALLIVLMLFITYRDILKLF